MSKIKDFAVMVVVIINYIAQIIASLLYSGLYGSLVVLISISPLFLLGRISLFWVFVIWFFLFDIVIGIQVLAQTIISLPYIWIVRDNLVSKIIAASAIICAGVAGCIKSWMIFDDMSIGLIILCVLVNIQIAFSVINTSIVVCQIGSD